MYNNLDNRLLPILKDNENYKYINTIRMWNPLRFNNKLEVIKSNPTPYVPRKTKASFTTEMAEDLNNFHANKIDTSSPVDYINNKYFTIIEIVYNKHRGYIATCRSLSNNELYKRYLTFILTSSESTE
jgi:hypothetical protein